MLKASPTFSEELSQHGIKKLYHFTDRSNLQSIINAGGLYSWHDCQDKGIAINKPGGSSLSRQLDCHMGLDYYVRTSFTRNHPMMYQAQKDGRLNDPIVLELDISIANLDVMFADRNAARTGSGVHVGAALSDLQRIHFDTVKQNTHFNLSDDERPYYQAEVMVHNFIPLEYITNIKDFGIPIPEPRPVAQLTVATPQVSAPAAQPSPAPRPILTPVSAQPKNVITAPIKLPYTAQITRNTPTAFIFLIDQSASMGRHTTLHGEQMTLAQAAARIVNSQIDELVLRCLKFGETRHYFDFAVIGYGSEAYSAWKGELEGRDFVSPLELKEHPYTRITVRAEKRTRKGVELKEVEKNQWIEARCDGNWTHLHKAFDRVRRLMDDWMEQHSNQDCYPPTIINITDGEFNGIAPSEVIDRACDLRARHTNDGNVLLFNIHISPDAGLSQTFPVEKSEVPSGYASQLYEMSSLLPERYNEPIAKQLGDTRVQRHKAMSINADMSTLIKLMDIGTPTNITQDPNR